MTILWRSQSADPEGLNNGPLISMMTDHDLLMIASNTHEDLKAQDKQDLRVALGAWSWRTIQSPNKILYTKYEATLTFVEDSCPDPFTL